MAQTVKINMLKEAEKTNLKFLDIYNIGQSLDKKLNLKCALYLTPYLEKLGAKIEKNDNIFSTNNHLLVNQDYMRIYHEKECSILIPSTQDLYFERILLAQSLGHFILHSKAGTRPCKIHRFYDSPTSVEGFWFALGLLTDIDYVIEVLNKGFSIPEVSKLFLIPEFAVNALILIKKRYN